jgi:nucleoside 2-deoxyribosyltransferase
MKKIYLCGGIKDLTKEAATEWRIQAIRELESQIINGTNYEFKFECLDPMRRNFRSNEWQSQNEIVNLDKKDIIECDILLVNATKPSWGTAMEVLFGFEKHKIIVAFTGSDNEKDWNPWLGFHATKLTKTLDEAIAYIIKHFG